MWHSGTFNIDAALKGSKLHTNVPNSNVFGSADIKTSWGQDIGLKYYRSAAESAKQQATNVLQKFNGIKSMEFVEYCTANGISEDNIYRSIYEGQLRIIPTEQLEGAREWLKRKIIEESVKRPEQAERYKETLAMLSDRISHENVSSTPLTNDKAVQMAVQSKNGSVTSETLGVSIEQQMKGKYIADQAMKAGAVSAAISLALKIVPVIISMIKKKKEVGELTENDFKELGISALQGGSEGFIRGSISAGFTAVCASGILGEGLKNISPSVVGALVTVIINTMKNGYFVAVGKMRPEQLADEFIQDIGTSAFAVVFGTAGNTVLPGIGYLIGSLVGSMVGSLVFSISKGTLGEIIDFFNEQADYFEAYAAELTKIDLKKFSMKTAFFSRTAHMIESANSQEELNTMLHRSLESLDIALPWKGDFNEFMSDRSNTLVFE